MENARSFCSLASQLTDVLTRDKVGLAHLSNLLKSSAQPPVKVPPIEALLTACEVLVNEWLLDNIQPIQRPAPELSWEHFQGMAGNEAALPIAQQLVFPVGSQEPKSAEQAATRHLLSSSSNKAPLSNSLGHGTAPHSAAMQSALQFKNLNDSARDKMWPFMGRPILSPNIAGPMLRPREITRGSVLVGGMLLKQHRTSPLSSQEHEQLCSSSRFATLLKNCTSSLPLQLGRTNRTSQAQDSAMRVKIRPVSWFRMWQLKHLGSAPEKAATDLAPFGTDSAYNTHSTLFSSTALFLKELFYDTRNGSNEIAARQKPYGFFAQESDLLQDSFAVVFPVHLCFLVAWHLPTCLNA